MKMRMNLTSEDVGESVDNYEDNEFDENRKRQWRGGARCSLKGTLETGNSSETDNPSQTSSPVSSVKTANDFE